MRILVVKGTEIDETGIVAMTCECLTTQMEEETGNILVQENPDVVHVLGALDRNTMNIVRQSLQRHIAVVYTPLHSLTPWSNPSATKVKLAAEVHVIIVSGEMENTLLGDRNQQEKTIIRNAVVTKTTTVSEMIAAYNETYTKAFNINEENLRRHIKERITLLNEEDAVITNICEQLLYAQYLYQRRNIPQPYLQSLSTFMTENDYDEERLMKLLQLLQLDIFTQQLEFVMKEQTGLTEGFMPVIWKEDKTAHDISTTITNYLQEQ